MKLLILWVLSVTYSGHASHYYHPDATSCETARVAAVAAAKAQSVKPFIHCEPTLVFGPDGKPMMQ